MGTAPTQDIAKTLNITTGGSNGDLINELVKRTKRKARLPGGNAELEEDFRQALIARMRQNLLRGRERTSSIATSAAGVQNAATIARRTLRG